MSDLLDDEDDGTESSLSRMFSISQLWSDFRTYYPLLILFVVVGLGAVIAFTILKSPVYTATAIVGPADNSDQPFGDSMGGGLSGGLGGIAKHLHVGGALGQQGDDTFDEYTSLLTSNRLAERLVRKDNFLREVFSDRWDSANNRWRPRDDFTSRNIDTLKGLLRRPVKKAPDQEDLEKYFKKYLQVDPSVETSFATVSLRFGNRKGAERLLGLILSEADNIIREDKRRDVAARIAYLNTALVHLALADQKPELIAVLSEQEQEMMMIESDHLYASKLIDAPYAPLTPTSPSPVVDSLIALGLAGLLWLALVRVSPAEGRWARILGVFACGKRGHHPDPVASRTPKFRDDPLADALPIPGVLSGAAGRGAMDPRSSPGNPRA